MSEEKIRKAFKEKDWNEKWALSVEPIRVGKRVSIRPSRSLALTDRSPEDIDLIINAGKKKTQELLSHIPTLIIINGLLWVVQLYSASSGTAIDPCLQHTPFRK